MICQYIPFYAIDHSFDILYPASFYRLTHVSTSEEDCPWFWRLGYMLRNEGMQINSESS